MFRFDWDSERKKAPCVWSMGGMRFVELNMESVGTRRRRKREDVGTGTIHALRGWERDLWGIASGIFLFFFFLIIHQETFKRIIIRDSLATNASRIEYTNRSFRYESNFFRISFLILDKMRIVLSFLYIYRSTWWPFEWLNNKRQFYLWREKNIKFVVTMNNLKINVHPLLDELYECLFRHF